MEDASKPEEGVKQLFVLEDFVSKSSYVPAQNPTLLSASTAILLLLLLLLPFNSIALLVGGASGMLLCERYPEQILPRVTAARGRAGVELRALVSRVKALSKREI